MDAGDFLPDAQTLSAIERDIDSYNQRRRYARKEVAGRMAGFFWPFALGAAVLVLLYLRHHAALPDILPVVFMIAGVGIAIWGHSFATRVGEEIQQEFRDHMLPVLFGWIEELRYTRGREPGTYAHIPDALKGGYYNEKSFDDVISGRLRGEPFDIYEAHLVERRRRTYKVRFDGLVLVCRTPEPFPGTLLAMRRPDGGLAASFDTMMRSLGEFLRRERMTPLESGTPLDDIYEFRSDRPEQARALVGGRIGEVLQRVAFTWPGGLPRLAVRRDALYLMLPSPKNFFELPPLEEPVSYRAHLEPMAKEFASLLTIVAEVQRPAVEEGEDPAAVEPSDPDATPKDAPPEGRKPGPDGRPFIPLLDGREPPPGR